ncbi:MAG: hypothetical protein GF330_06725 [Candidatus Eisenbacteria bacterium]|nr:hypothetical protein [Candidatus Eisenbacteria bacterium]
MDSTTALAVLDRAGLRAPPWGDAREPQVRERWERGPGPNSAAGVSRASVGIVHCVPPPLRHIGCMWLEDGDEQQRCGAPVRWTVGASLDLPRLYCEHHGQWIWEKKHSPQSRQRQVS